MRGTQASLCGYQVDPVDHPRACGEHQVDPVLGDDAVGSSPRMRGTPAVGELVHPLAGIIPAHAGNTPIDSGEMLNARDHPRACGEHSWRVISRLVLSGSSPRMRGTRRRGDLRPRLLGIIPAHAGNTSSPPAVFPGRRDHPRACGEHHTPCAGGIRLRGSSPRMRGTPRDATEP